MPLLAVEATKMSREHIERGFVEEIIANEAMFAVLPFVKSNDEIYSYRREKTLAKGVFLDPYEVIEESASTFDAVSTKIKRFAGQVDVDNFMDEVQNSLNDQTAMQLAMKAKGMSLQFKEELIIGNTSTNAKTFDGLTRLTPSAQTISAGVNGGAVSLALVDELKDTVKLGADVLMMRTGTWRGVRGLIRAMGGNTAEHVMLENFGRPVPAIDGTPVIINDFIPVNEVQGTANNTTSIYALRLNEVDGLHGLYAGENAGMKLEQPWRLEDKDATRWRLRWYCGLALKATHGVARLKGVSNI